MTTEGVRVAFEALVREAVEQVVTTEEALTDVRGAAAIYDTRRDDKFKALASFEPAATAVAALPKFDERIGAASAERATLQVVYNCFTRAAHVGFDEDALDFALDGFTSELAKPTW